MDRIFTRIASRIAGMAGQPGAFLLALGIVAIWAVTGPLFGFTDTWQLVINTGHHDRHFHDGVLIQKRRPDPRR